MAQRASPSSLEVVLPDLPKRTSYRLRPGHPTPGWPSLLRHPITQTSHYRYGNFNPFPIAYAFQPRLRGRLTLSGLTFLRKPWVFGGEVSHLSYRYLCRHDHFHPVHHASRRSFVPEWNAPLPIMNAEALTIPQLRY